MSASLFQTLSDVRNANRDSGRHFFDPDTLHFFKSKVDGSLYGGRCFVTSEKPPQGVRGYTVRYANDDASIDTIGEFMGHPTLDAARRAAKRLVRGES